MLRIILFTLLNFLLLSCGPTIHYLGDSYQPVSTVQVYYDSKEVKKEYKIIGRMTNGEVVAYGTKNVKQKMIEKAKGIGADGIIFSSLSMGEDNGSGEIKAELIKFL